MRHVPTLIWAFYFSWPLHFLKEVWITYERHRERETACFSYPRFHVAIQKIQVITGPKYLEK